MKNLGLGTKVVVKENHINTEGEQSIKTSKGLLIAVEGHMMAVEVGLVIFGGENIGQKTEIRPKVIWFNTMSSSFREVSAGQ